MTAQQLNEPLMLPHLQTLFTPPPPSQREKE